eukprot:PhF_6_TR669/c0_g1_i1/m.1008
MQIPVVHASRWEDKSSCSACSLCKTDFGWFETKTNCYSCGRVVCEMCTSPEPVILPPTYTDPVPCCTQCFSMTEIVKKNTLKPTVAATKRNVVDLREVLFSFFSAHDKARIPSISSLLAAYRGKEDELLYAVGSEYPHVACELVIYVGVPKLNSADSADPSSGGASKQNNAGSLAECIAEFFPAEPAELLGSTAIAEEKIWKALFEKYNTASEEQKLILERRMLVKKSTESSPSMDKALDQMSAPQLAEIVRRQRRQIDEMKNVLSQLRVEATTSREDMVKEQEAHAIRLNDLLQKEHALMEKEKELIALRVELENREKLFSKEMTEGTKKLHEQEAEVRRSLLQKQDEEQRKKQQEKEKEREGKKDRDKDKDKDKDDAAAAANAAFLKAIPDGEEDDSIFQTFSQQMRPKKIGEVFKKVHAVTQLGLAFKPKGQGEAKSPRNSDLHIPMTPNAEPLQPEELTSPLEPKPRKIGDVFKKVHAVTQLSLAFKPKSSGGDDAAGDGGDLTSNVSFADDPMAMSPKLKERGKSPPATNASRTKSPGLSQNGTRTKSPGLTVGGASPRTKSPLKGGRLSPDRLRADGDTNDSGESDSRVGRAFNASFGVAKGKSSS